MKRLMHCPFCGEEEQLNLSDDLNGDTRASWLYVVKCRGCGAHGPEGESASKDTAQHAAIDAWNNRLAPAEDVALRVAFTMS